MNSYNQILSYDSFKIFSHNLRVSVKEQSSPRCASFNWSHFVFQQLASFGSFQIGDDVAKCTCLVTDKIRRTVKFLCALSQGSPIVGVEWVDACIKQQSVVGSHLPSPSVIYYILKVYFREVAAYFFSWFFSDSTWRAACNQKTLLF